MNKFLMIAATASLTLASCSKEQVAELPSEASSEIRFGAQALSADTRSPFDGTISGTNKLTAQIIGSATSNNYATPYTNNAKEAKGDITFEDSGTTKYGFPSGVTWKDETPTLYFRGFYPGGATWTTTGGTQATATIDGKTDLMLAPQISGTKADNLSFVFGHLLTKLHVKVIGNTTTSIEWGTIDKIELTKALNVAPFNSVAHTFATANSLFSTAGLIPFYEATAAADNKVTYTDAVLTGKAIEIPASGSASLVGYSLVAPVIAAEGTGAEKDEYTLKIYTSVKATLGREVAINLKNTEGTDFVGSTAGKKFDITVQFLAEGQIAVTATVTDWVDGGSGSGQM